MIEDVRELVAAKWPPPVGIQIFGSYHSGLSIFLSDIDITILGLGVGADSEAKSSMVQPLSRAPLTGVQITGLGMDRMDSYTNSSQRQSQTKPAAVTVIIDETEVFEVCMLFG